MLLGHRPACVSAPHLRMNSRRTMMCFPAGNSNGKGLSAACSLTETAAGSDPPTVIVAVSLWPMEEATEVTARRASEIVDIVNDKIKGRSNRMSGVFIRLASQHMPSDL